MDYKCVFVIPVFRHGSTLGAVVENLQEYKLPIIIVDDGNDEKNRAFIDAVSKKYPLITLVTRKKNGGKGRAMKDGILKAHELGFTHVFQIDSDGQHDTSAVPRFLEKSKAHPACVICAYPSYSADAPAHRVKGRTVANTWVHIVTLNRHIQDGMIGFRIYPVKDCYKIYCGPAIIDARMGFDIDLLVHLCWRGLAVLNEEVRVLYPQDGISNFRVVRDNLRISAMYTRLCCTLIVKFPFILVRKFLRRGCEGGWLEKQSTVALG